MATIIFDFDGTLYQTPTPDIPKLEDAIDLAMLRLFTDKLKTSTQQQKILAYLNEQFSALDKEQIGANLYNQNSDNRGHKSKTLAGHVVRDGMTFAELLKRKDNRTKLFCARALAQMMHPNGNGNHRVSGMLSLGLDITKQDIADYYRRYATLKYKTIKPNLHIQQIVQAAKKRGDTLVIYTDNSKENVKANLKRVGCQEKDFAVIVDMFDCNGGMTKKMYEGREAFREIMKKMGIDLHQAKFYDDNPKICEYMHEHFHFSSVCVKTHELIDVATGKKLDTINPENVQTRLYDVKKRLHKQQTKDEAGQDSKPQKTYQEQTPAQPTSAVGRGADERFS